MSSLVGGSLSGQLNSTVGAMLISKLFPYTQRSAYSFSICSRRDRWFYVRWVTLYPFSQSLTFIRLQGVTTCQTIIYFRRSKSDPLVVRSLVICLSHCAIVILLISYVDYVGLFCLVRVTIFHTCEALFHPFDLI